jgi:hypothetical protein
MAVRDEGRRKMRSEKGIVQDLPFQLGTGVARGGTAVSVKAGVLYL